MSFFPKDSKKIRELIKRYEQGLRAEYKKYQAYDDGGGKRYLIGPLYLLAGDHAGALKSFAWFENEFPDDSGEPFHWLSWAFAWYRSGDLPAATQKLRQAMFSNLYLIPYLLGIDQPVLDIWHGSNLEEEDYVKDYAPPELIELWDQPAREWAAATYRSPEFEHVRARYIEIGTALQKERPGPIRSQLVDEQYAMKKGEIK